MKLHRALGVLAVIAVVGFAASAIAGSSDFLTSKTGMTIYTFDKDSVGKSACNGSCVAIWPPVPAADSPAANTNWGTIEREDGIKQLTHKGQPVYYYVQDRQPGDANGDNIKGVWHIVRQQVATSSKRRAYNSGYSHSSDY